MLLERYLFLIELVDVFANFVDELVVGHSLDDTRDSILVALLLADELGVLAVVL